MFYTILISYLHIVLFLILTFLRFKSDTACYNIVGLLSIKKMQVQKPKKYFRCKTKIPTKHLIRNCRTSSWEIFPLPDTEQLKPGSETYQFSVVVTNSNTRKSYFDDDLYLLCLKKLITAGCLFPGTSGC